MRLPPKAPGQREQIEQGIAWAKDLSENEKQSILTVLPACRMEMPSAMAISIPTTSA